MALIFPSTPCFICGKPLGDRGDLVAFPAFVVNRKDPIYPFSDSAVHRRCFVSHPLAQKAQSRLVEEERQVEMDYVCLVCGESISTSEDCFTVGFLIDDPAVSVFEFNYSHIHGSHFLQWARAGEFQAKMQEFLASPLWEGPRLVFDPIPRWLSETELPFAKMREVRRPTKLR